MTKEAIRMEFDRIYAKAMASLAQGNDTAAKNYLTAAASKLSALLSKTEGEEREAVQAWILDIGGQIEKLRIRIENEKLKPQIMEKLGQTETHNTAKRKPFLVDAPDVTFEDVAGMYEVKEIAIRRVIAGSMKNKKFTKEDFDEAMKEVRSSVAKKDISRLENWEKENVQDAI